jgi:hypothetical protein
MTAGIRIYLGNINNNLPEQSLKMHTEIVYEMYAHPSVDLLRLISHGECMGSYLPYINPSYNGAQGP